MTEPGDIPEGYGYEPSASPAVNHMGRLFRKRLQPANGAEQVWSALRVEPHHANAWSLCHGTILSGLAEIGNSSAAYVESLPPAVVVDMTITLMKAPKVGDLIEVCGVIIRRTRSLVFTQATAFVNGEIVLSSSATHKVVGA